MDNLKVLSEQMGAYIEELMCPHCFSELKQVSKHILVCGKCQKAIGQFKAGETVIEGAPPCPRCNHAEWMVLLSSEQIQCPICDYIHEPNLI